MDFQTTSLFSTQVFLSAASKAILIKWYRLGQDRVRKRGGRAGKAQVSDDDKRDDSFGGFGKLQLSQASKAIMVKWLSKLCSPSFSLSCRFPSPPFATTFV